MFKAILLTALGITLAVLLARIAPPSPQDEEQQVQTNFTNSDSMQAIYDGLNAKKTWYQWRYFNIMKRVHSDANFTYYKDEAWLKKFEMVKVPIDDIKETFDLYFIARTDAGAASSGLTGAEIHDESGEIQKIDVHFYDVQHVPAQSALVVQKFAINVLVSDSHDEYGGQLWNRVARGSLQTPITLPVKQVELYQDDPYASAKDVFDTEKRPAIVYEVPDESVYEEFWQSVLAAFADTPVEKYVEELRASAKRVECVVLKTYTKDFKEKKHPIAWDDNLIKVYSIHAPKRVVYGVSSSIEYKASKEQEAFELKERLMYAHKIAKTFRASFSRALRVLTQE